MGWWVGTVGTTEVLEGGEEASHIADGAASARGDGPNRVRDDSQAEQESEFQVNERPEGEMAEDGWWDLELDWPGLEDEREGAPQAGPPHHFPYNSARPNRPAATGQQKLRKRPRANADH
jgi:hypothetical protein